jgi:hypothetical protein
MTGRALPAAVNRAGLCRAVRIITVPRPIQQCEKALWIYSKNGTYPALFKRRAFLLRDEQSGRENIYEINDRQQRNRYREGIRYGDSRDHKRAPTPRPRLKITFAAVARASVGYSSDRRAPYPPSMPLTSIPMIAPPIKSAIGLVSCE